MGDNIAPPRRDALAAAGGLERHARENLDEEIVGELGERVPLRVHLTLGATRRHGRTICRSGRRGETRRPVLHGLDLVPIELRAAS
jgi:hypothetical protein